MKNIFTAVRPYLLGCCLGLGLGTGAVQAEVRLPALVGSNMVLQHDVPVRIWGWAEAGEKVTVTLGGVATGTATGAGETTPWSLLLPPLKAGPVPEIVITGKNTLTLSNVLAGEVWLCSGQSNMEMAVGKARNAAAEIAAARYPEIRFFQVRSLEPGDATVPRQECRGAWTLCSPETVGSFSATGYYFGRELFQQLKIPVGLIQSSVGGTPAEYWVPDSALNGDAAFDPMAGYLYEYPVRMRIHGQYMEAWKKKAEVAKAAGKPEPPAPKPPVSPEELKPKFSTLYNSLIHPVIPYTIKGVLWYQGETNGVRAFQYRTLLTKLIASWRAAWGQGDIPFVIVQLANFDASYLVPGAWAELREAQAQVAREVPQCALAVTIDTGGPKGNLHPENKQDAGKRSALAALTLAYGSPVISSGPTLETATFANGAAVVKFQNKGGGLVAGAGGPLQGFTLAGEDRRFYPAEAVIEGETVTVRSAQVPQPIAVRYGWTDNPACTLYNVEGLPAVPFRSDEWPGPTGKAQ